MKALVPALLVTLLGTTLLPAQNPVSEASLPYSREENLPGANLGRPRVVVLTDFPPLDVRMDSGPANKRSDPDDLQSMVRFLLYANDLEVEGLIATSATFANMANKQPLVEMLETYGAVVGNLKKHDPRYPSANYLRSITWQGLSGSYGKPAKEILGPGKDSEASEKIIGLLEKEDPRPVWFCVWGGSGDLVQALWKIRETRDKADAARLLGKARIYLIGQQDGSGQWLLDNFPQMFIIVAKTSWMGMFGTGDLQWLNTHVRQDHGLLGALYPPEAMGTKPGVKEGDSPSFLYLVSATKGLNDLEKPDQPSWGGQFVRMNQDRNHWVDHPAGGITVKRWNGHFNQDFAARMDWCVREYKEANHPPIARVVVPGGSIARVGSMVHLEGTATDPDNDRLTFQWTQPFEPDSGKAKVSLIPEMGPEKVGFLVPNNPGKVIQLTLEVADNGKPALTSYRTVTFRIEP